MGRNRSRDDLVREVRAMAAWLSENAEGLVAKDATSARFELATWTSSLPCVIDLDTGRTACRLDNRIEWGRA